MTQVDKEIFRAGMICILGILLLMSSQRLPEGYDYFFGCLGIAVLMISLGASSHIMVYLLFNKE